VLNIKHISEINTTISDVINKKRKSNGNNMNTLQQANVAESIKYCRNTVSGTNDNGQQHKITTQISTLLTLTTMW